LDHTFLSSSSKPLKTKLSISRTPNTSYSTKQMNYT
jgi:hypothetical protein